LLYSGIDFFKLIAAVLVVVLHGVETTAFYPCGVKYIFTRLAVPFFFIASGFFFYRGIAAAKDSWQYFLRYEKNLWKIFTVWALIIYMPFTVMTYLSKYPHADATNLVLLLFRRVFIIGPGPYWYLVALMCSAGVLYLIHTRGNDTVLYICIVLGFILEILYSCFRGVLGDIPLFAVFF